MIAGSDRGAASWGMAMILSFLLGCAPDPIEMYRIGEKIDVEDYRREFGEENVSVIRQDVEQYEYRRCTLDRRDVRYEIDVSTEGRIVGLTVKMPCKGSKDILSKRTSIEKRFNARYAGGDFDAMGNIASTDSASAPVEIKVKYEPGSMRIVASCYEADHAKRVLAYRGRVRKPER